jgi:formylglycine-generating enzyme
MRRLPRAMVAALLMFVSVSVTGACDRELPPLGQVVVYVDTDAIVRSPAGSVEDPALLSPLVDRARFEVLRGGVPLANSTRDVVVDAAMFRERRVSFGVVAPPGATDVSVRIRLFRADRVLTNEPEAGVSLDSTVVLPPVPEEGIVDVGVILFTDDFGVHRDAVAPTIGVPSSSRVGTWRGGRRVDCSEGARPNEACVPGAAFFMGNPQLRGRNPIVDIAEERLVSVSPFFLELTEVTVETFRREWPSLQGKVPEPTLRSADAYCTWTATPDGEGERRPLNCVSWTAARAYCQAIGKDLPTEAELELVASGVGEETAFPWGNDEPECAQAVWGCAGITSAKLDIIRFGADQCVTARPGPGPLPAGQGLRDRLSSAVLRNSGGGEVLDVGGNLAEWARDVWARPTDAFWAPVRMMTDPLNTTPNAMEGDVRPIRGGDWTGTANLTRAGIRRRRGVDEQQPHVGFRCMRPGRP